jgi:hypothetical protein
MSFKAGDRRRGRELPGDRPARVAPDRSQPPLQLVVVHLHDDAVDLEVEAPALLLPGQALRHHLVLARELADIAVDAESVGAQPVERLPVRGEGDALRRADAVAPHGQRALGGERRVELADGARRGVARVHEGGEALLGSALVEPAKSGNDM